MRLADVSIRRPVFAVMLIGGLVVLGLVSIPRLGLDLFPRVEFPIVTVTTLLEGASPETVEREVSQVLEQSVNTIDGIRTLSSQSSEALSILFVEFDLEHDAQEKAQQVRERVAAVRGELPRDVKPPVVERVDPDAAPILAVMLAGSRSIRALSELADKRVKPRLERIDGVGSVQLLGARPRQIRVWIDPVRLAGYGLAVDDVLAALEREHVELPAGRLESAAGEWALETEARVTRPEQFGRLVVSERGGRVVRLEDVTRVEDGMADERTLSRLNGRRGVSLLVRRQSGANTVAVADAVKAELERIRAELPPGHELAIALDSSVFIRSAVRGVAIDLAYGALLAAAIVLVFLRSVRSTVITAVAIPTSLLASFVFFTFFDFTLNTMTLMALSLSIGLLIDDAIVVLESAHRHVQAGASPAEAAARGTREVGLAVVASTLGVCAVFLPIAFMSGLVGRFFREFGLVTTAAVLASMLVSLSLTPMLCARFLRAERGDENRAARALDSVHRALETSYRRTLAWGLAHRPSVVALTLVAVMGGVALARALPRGFITPEDRSEFNVWIERPLGSSLAQTQEAVAAVEQSLRALPEVRLTFATIGHGAKRRANEAELYVQLVHKSERAKTQQQLMDDVRERIRALALPAVEFSVEHLPVVAVAGGRQAELMYAFQGPEIERLRGYVAALVSRMRAAGGYADVWTSFETGKPEIALELERERAADLGVPALQVGRTLAALYSGADAASFEEGGERYDVRVQLLPEYRDDLSKLDLVRVRSSSGALVPLRNLVTPRIGSGPVQIDRDGRTRGVVVYANLAEKTAGVADAEVTRFASELALADGDRFRAIGPSQRMRESFDAVLFAFALALGAIYMILAAQFDSFSQPILIMLAAPLSFVGAFAAVALFGQTLDIMAQIAFLMLMGIVMKNGILLVDYTNALRARGRPLREAVLEAGPVRLRPVLMTAVSTVLGMLPVALGRGDGSEWRSPMGVICIGGLVTSTALTLLVVPVFYTLFADAQAALARGVARLRGARVRADSRPVRESSAAAIELDPRVALAAPPAVRPRVDLDTCRACVWTCSAFCPLRAIALGADGLPRIDYERCDGCGLCIESCPQRGIRAEEPVSPPPRQLH
jgi:HAE1 family hydrophobic/amphiphilic exporter-1